MIRNFGYKILVTTLSLVVIVITIVSFSNKAYDPCPPGAIMQFSGTTAPVGYMICDGSAVSRTTFAHLFAVIGTTYGAGDGSTTFNVPDLRQRFPLGKAASGTGSTLGGTGGAIDHTHTITPSSLPNISLIGIGTAADDVEMISSAANPPFISLNYIIKF